MCPVPATSVARAGSGGRAVGGGVNCVAFGTGATNWWHLATAANDQRIMIWDLYPPEVAAVAAGGGGRRRAA